MYIFCIHKKALALSTEAQSSPSIHHTQYMTCTNILACTERQQTTFIFSFETDEKLG